MQEENSFYMANILSRCSKYVVAFIFMIFVGAVAMPEANASEVIEGPCIDCVVTPPIAEPPDSGTIDDGDIDITPDDPIVTDPPDGPGVDDGDNDSEIKPDPGPGPDPGPEPDPGPVDPPDPGPEPPVDPIDCDDEIGCTLDSLIEGTCQNEPDDSLCDNGLFCDGEETCDAANGCQPGTSPIMDDGIECTIEECDEENNSISIALNNALCDDGLFCNGSEQCTLDGCGPGMNAVPDDLYPCTDRRCDEEADEYVFDPKDSKCDNGVFCDGEEICNPEADPQGDGCVADPEPPIGELCSEDGSRICSEELQCVETTGTIKIVKMAHPNDGKDFLFSCSDQDGNPCEGVDIAGPGMFHLDDEVGGIDDTPGMLELSAIPAGTYIIQETLPEGWGIADIVCENEEGERSEVIEDQAVIDLEPFEEATCTFFNELLCGNGMPDDGEECDPATDPEFCSDECVLFDSDGDGVTDEFDECPDTPEGDVVDEQGCTICDCDHPNAITEGLSTRRGTYFFGTFGDDIICGTSERDMIFAFSGDDCIDSGEGGDFIFAGFGNDLIFAGPDNDRVFAGPGDDEADGEEGRDFVHGGSGVDMCFGERLRRCE